MFPACPELVGRGPGDVPDVGRAGRVCATANFARRKRARVAACAVPPRRRRRRLHAGRAAARRAAGGRLSAHALRALPLRARQLW